MGNNCRWTWQSVDGNMALTDDSLAGQYSLVWHHDIETFLQYWTSLQYWFLWIQHGIPKYNRCRSGKNDPVVFRIIFRWRRSLFVFFYRFSHDDVIKWKDFPRYWPFVRGIHLSPVNSPHKGQWRGSLLSLILVWISDWVNNREAGDLRRYRAHYDVIVMQTLTRRRVFSWNVSSWKTRHSFPTQSISSLLMTRWHMAPGHQLSRYRLSSPRIFRP